jgi:ATP-dependent Clp protease ATP-binding subunit ClpC
MVPLTERARDVIELARREAADLRHGHVGTEHVLLGILREGGGLADRLSTQLGIEIDKIRKAVVQLNPVTAPVGSSHTQLPFSDHLRGALKSAEERARELGHNGIGIGHLFLGMVEIETCKGALLLINLGLNPLDTRRELLELMSPRT